MRAAMRCCRSRKWGSAASGPDAWFALASRGCKPTKGMAMSGFVQFPEHVFDQAGNVFAGFDGTLSQYAVANARSLMWFAQLAYEVDNTGVHPEAAATVDR